MQSDGIMGESSYWRSVYAIRAYQQARFHDVVVAGGGGPGQSIAESMRNFLEAGGVPRPVIHLEVSSRSTRENALYTKELLAGLPGEKVLLTSDFHMLRAYRSFKKVGVDVLPRPSPDVIKRGSTYQTRWSAFLELVRETAALGYYFARGWI